MKKILFIFGTRPEGIKLAPLINKFNEQQEFKTFVCITSQHQGLLQQVLNFFKIDVHFDLNVMTHNQSLNYVTSKIVAELENIFAQIEPNLTFVQGDTTSCFAGALSSFYSKVPVAHIEAGLRTHDKLFPFPEEVNRILTDHIADYHFAPTEKAVNNLKSENIDPNKIFMVGNTGIDAQKYVLEKIRENEKEYLSFFNKIDFSKKIILVTCHRRENFGTPLKNIFDALIEISTQFEDIEIIYPVHPNPNVVSLAFSIEISTQFEDIEIIYPVHPNPNVVSLAFSALKSSRIHLFDPLDYPTLMFALKKSYLILTDSGGIQEEAPSLGKPVLIMRDKTERPECIELGIAKLVGTNTKTIVQSIAELLSDKQKYSNMARVAFPFGEGNASEKIVQIIKDLHF